MRARGSIFAHGSGRVCSRAFLVQGSYPEELLASWDDYKEKQSPPSDEQIRPRECTLAREAGCGMALN